MMGGSLYIFLSNDCFLIKCYLLIKKFLWFGKAGWYVVLLYSRLPFSKFNLEGFFRKGNL